MSPLYCTDLTLRKFNIIKKSKEFSLQLQISIIVSIAVSKVDMTELIFVVAGMKVNDKYYHDVSLCQQMLPTMQHVPRDTFVFHLHSTPCHSRRTPLNIYRKRR